MSIADDIELLVQATDLIVHIEENQKYLDAAGRVEVWLATNAPKDL